MNVRKMCRSLIEQFNFQTETGAIYKIAPVSLVVHLGVEDHPVFFALQI